MIEQKSQNITAEVISAVMDDNISSDDQLEMLVKDPEMRTIWSRFHLISDIIQGEVPEVINLQLDSRIALAIQDEPAIFVPQEKAPQEKISATKGEVISLGNSIRNWAEQATGLAIAASVTAFMVFGVQMLNTPDAIDSNNSAITSLELLNVDNSLISEKTEYTDIQEILLDHTRTDSLYGLQNMKPFVSVVSHSIPVVLKPTSDNNYYNLDKDSDEKDKNADPAKK